MNELAQIHCSPINANSVQLNEVEISQLIKEIPGWAACTKRGELCLEKLFKFQDFNQAVAFTNLIAQEANKEDHHPAILTEWGKVTVSWWTHKIKGLHKIDFILAAKTDRLFEGASE
jgi:4a-hydroxytetrahydrobiopterin dehydratase